MSAWSNLVPLVILFVVLSAGAFVGYQLYLWSNQLADRGIKKMAKKNVVFNKDGGVKIGVKNMSEEDYAAKQQNYLVKAWNLSSMPAYKSLFWNKAEQAKQKGSLLAANGDKEAERKLSSANSSRSGSYVTGLSASGSNIGQRHSVSSPGGFPE